MGKHYHVSSFSLTLIDYPCIWFNDLIEKSISFFEGLRREFIQAFIINNQTKKNVIYLLNIQQSNQETFKQYVDQFRNAVLEI